MRGEQISKDHLTEKREHCKPKLIINVLKKPETIIVNS